MKRQNGACSLVSDGSTAASEPDAGACGSGSPRSKHAQENERQKKGGLPNSEGSWGHGAGRA